MTTSQTKKIKWKKCQFRIVILALCFLFIYPFTCHLGNSLLSQNTNNELVKTSGKVLDEDSNPLIGVTVYVKGNSAYGTTTNHDGEFSLNLPKNSILVVSYIGYNTVEIQATESMVIRMKENTKMLDEIVVVGYTVQRKESLTGSLSSVDNKKLVDATTPNVSNLLSGKATGVFVNQGSGKPGSEAQVIIRGKTTVNGSTNPLWVIDGVIVGTSAYDLNPNDIENLTILKDAASTAIYGSQGANGVIIVTTKKGQSGDPKINFSTKIAANKLTNGRMKIMNGAELYDYYDKGEGAAEGFKSNWTPALRNRDYNWWDGATQTGIAQEYNLSISGGSENLKTYFSLGYYDEKGAVKGYDYKRYSTMLKIDYTIFDIVTLKPSFYGSRRDIHDQQHSLSAMYSNLPWDNPYTTDGNLLKGGISNDPLSNWINSTGTNYLYDLQWNYSENRNYELNGNFDFDIRITPWLTYASVNNYKYNDYKSMSYVDARSSAGINDNGSVEDYSTSYDKIYTSQLLRFSKIFADKHIVNAVAGYEWNEYNFKTSTSKGKGIPPGFTANEIAAAPSSVKGYKEAWAIQSFLSNVNYDYDGKYLGQISFRRDGSSKFSKDSRYGNFFSVSGGWNIHAEDFFDVNQINRLKLRASFGSVGNLPNSMYPQYTLYKVTKYNETYGGLLNQMGNKDITWEKSYTTSIGLDTRLFNRVNLSLDFYYKNTSDLLFELPLPSVIGVTKVWKNVGSVKNRGFEASFDVDILKNNDLYWGISANIGLNKNKLDKLYEGQDQIIASNRSNIAGTANTLLKPGYNVDTWYLPEWAGVNSQTGASQWYKTDTDGKRVLTEVYAEADPVAIGRYSPDFYGGFSTNLTYKQFDFGAVFSYSVGGKIYNYARQEYDSDGAYTDRNQMKLHSGWSRWEKEGDTATHPKLVYGNATNSNKFSSRFLETGTYLKLRSISLGYNMTIPKLKIENLRISGNIENVFTISHFSGVDPEIPANTNGEITGVAATDYPKTRRFVLGINLTF